MPDGARHQAPISTSRRSRLQSHEFARSPVSVVAVRPPAVLKSTPRTVLPPVASVSRRQTQRPCAPSGSPPRQNSHTVAAWISPSGRSIAQPRPFHAVKPPGTVSSSLGPYRLISAGGGGW
ncbi:hypothetical protein ACWEPC_09915 [Nonomuraea sp. NPDC004297]